MHGVSTNTLGVPQDQIDQSTASKTPRDFLPSNHPNSDLRAIEIHKPAFSFHNPLKVKNLDFKKIDNSSIENQDHETKKILKKFQISENSNNQALIDNENNRLIIVSDGPTAFRELFNNSWSNLMFGWIRTLAGKGQRNLVSDWEKEGLKYSQSKSDRQAQILEPMSHIRKALRLNHYKAVTMFYLDKETNKFKTEPEAIALITQYEPLLDEVIKSAPQEQVELAKKIKDEEIFSNWFCADQFIVNPSSSLELKEITHNTCEALFASNGFKGLTVHYRIHNEDNATSNDLSYDSIPWKHLYQRNDESWKSSDDNHPHSKITVVRGKSSRSTSIPKELAYMHAWAQMALGRSFEENESNLDLVHNAAKSNTARLGDFNQAITLNLSKTAKS
jgi:hypothetical protein